MDVPVKFDDASYKFSVPHTEKVLSIFKELEFRRMGENFIKTYKVLDVPYNLGTEKQEESSALRLFSDENESSLKSNVTLSTKKTLKTTSHFYQIVDSVTGIALLLGKLLQQKIVCFDTETTHLDALKAALVGIAFSWEKNKGYYLVFPPDFKESQEIIEKIRPFFENKNIMKVAHNLKYDYKVLLKYNIKVVPPFFDTMLAHYLIDPDTRHNMDVLAANYLNYEPQSITELIGKKGRKSR